MALTAAFAPARKEQAGLWLRLSDILCFWDERNYKQAEQRLGKLIRDWQTELADLQSMLQHMHATLADLTSHLIRNGMVAWDIYFQAQRMEQQRHLGAALEHYWIAIENITFERLARNHSTNANDLGSAVDQLRDHLGDAEVISLWNSPKYGASFGDAFWHLRTNVRNKCVHYGRPPTSGEVAQTRELAHAWITTLGSSEPVGYPLATQHLDRLCSAFAI